LKGSCETKPRYTPLQLSAGFAVAVLTLSILSIIALRPDNDINDLQHSADGFQLSSIDELPTDFLLETPWSQLASLEPEPQLLDLPYDLLEELPDEP
jgi:hypothetical protein